MTRTLTERRAEVGLLAPTPEQKLKIWERARLSAFIDQSTGYQPYKPFERAHFSEASTVLVTGAERVGKSVATAMEAIAWVPFSRLIWFLAPTYALARKEFEYTMEGLLSMKLISKSDYSLPRKAHMSAALEVPAYHCRAETKTMADIVAVMSAEAPDIILMCEPGKLDESPLDRTKIRLSTRRGRLWMAGSLEESSDWLRQCFDRWKSWPNDELARAYSAPLWINTQDFPGGNKNPEIEMMRTTMSRNLFLEKIAAVPAPPDTLVFRQLFRHGQNPFNARPCPFTPLDQNGQLYPVELAIDPGFRPSNYAVLAIQRHGDEVWVIDEVSGQGMTHEQIIAQCRVRDWWPNVIGGTIDPYAAPNHGMGYAHTPHEIWVQETQLPIRASIKPPVEMTVERMNFFIQHPITGDCRLFFDPQRCPLRLYEFKHWRYTRDVEGRPIRTSPMKRNCDALKALGYFLVDLYSTTAWNRNFPIRQPRILDWSVR